MTTPGWEGTWRRVGTVAWSALGTLLLAWVALWLLVRVWIIVPPIVFAVALLYVLNPLVVRLERHGVARWMGSCLSYLALIGLLVLVGFLVWPSLSEQGRELADNFPTIYDNLVEDIESIAAELGADDLDLLRYDELSERFADGSNAFFTDQWDRISDITLGLLEGIFVFLLAPVVAFYVLLDLPRIRETTIDLIPERLRAETLHVTRQVGTAVGGFLRGQLFVALIVGLLTSIGFRLIDLPFWLLIGMIAGLLNIVPFVGPWVGGALGVMVALATRDLSTALWAAGVALIVQQIDNHFISPTVLRATVRLHPSLIILGLIAGGAIGGFWGVLLAVPVMAIVKIVAGHFWRTRILHQSWEQAADAVIVENPTAETLIVRLRKPGDGPGSEDPSNSEET